MAAFTTPPLKLMTMRNTSLSKMLKQYSAMSSCIVAVSQFANAQIVYHDINPDSVLYVGGSFPGTTDSIDLNNDGQYDFAFYAREHQSYQVIGIAMRYSDVNTNALLGSVHPVAQNHPYLSVFDLAQSDNIGATSPFYSMPDMQFSYGVFFIPGMGISFSFSGVHGHWPGVTDKFIGVRFRDGNNIYYGWIRCDMAPDASSVTIKDYAYNADGGSILAGEGIATAVPSQTNSNLSAFVYNDVLNIMVREGDLNHSSVTVTNLLGETVIAKTLSEEITRLNVRALPKGIYFVNLFSGGELFSKKVSLQ